MRTPVGFSENGVYVVTDKEIFIDKVNCEFGKDCSGKGCSGASHYMTEQEINEMVARKLGYEIQNGSIYWESIPDDVMAEAHPIAAYCTSIEAAWEVVEFVKDKFFSLEHGTLQEQWMASWNWAEGEQTDFVVIGEGSTAPMAICSAFLKLP